MFQAYIIRCLVNGKSYIGITSRGIARRWTEHLYDARQRRPRMAISRAIARHGAQQFEIEAICSARSWADLCKVESDLIEQYGTRLRQIGYNLSDGGSGPFGAKRSAASVERSAAKHRGKPCHPNTRAAAALTHAGKPKSAEHRAKIAASKRGQPRSDAVKAKIAAYWAKRRAEGAFKTERAYAHHAK